MTEEFGGIGEHLKARKSNSVSGTISGGRSEDEEGRRGILQNVFVKFVVDRQRIVDIEVKPPYSWLMRWKPMQVAGENLSVK
ncbi:MAG TPA: hypothetical protein VMX96_04485 [Dehalococcoidia bacterium]|nr:hypothetical protein [Dehalococcoidia bacterium]